MDNIRKRKIYLTSLNQELAIEHNSNSLPLSVEQIESIATLNPSKIEDLEAVSGLGKVLIERYGQRIVEGLKSFNQSLITTFSDQSVNMTLKELQKKLINISKRNKLLYLGKLNKTNYDLSILEDEQLLSILFDGQRVELVNLEKDKQQKTIFTTLKNINNAARASAKETGNFDLFIATPFVTGIFVEDNFTLRAPLALFPVTLEISNQSISIKRDEEKDILINTNLLVAHYHFTKNNKALNPMELERLEKEGYLETIQSIYKQEGFDYKPSQDSTFITFNPMTVDDFKDYNVGVFESHNHIVLGHFPILSTSLQRDYASLSQVSEFPAHLLTLLETLSEETFDEEEPINQPDITKFTETHLAYINALNSSQEQAQLLVKKGENLVIQGPPGTGKSQTISNIIAQSIFDKKNVLMVSEKKAAIDVVYSRLMGLNEYALLIHSINDKKNFYSQCERIFTPKNINKTEINLQATNEAMDQIITEITEIKELLTTPVTDKETIMDLYQRVQKIDYLDEEVFKQYDFLKKHTQGLTLSDLELFAKEVTDENINDILIQQSVLSNISNLNDYNTTLSDYDILTLKQQIPLIEASINDYESSNPLKKLFNKNKVEQQLEPLKALNPNINVLKFKEAKLVIENYSIIINPKKLNFSNDKLNILSKVGNELHLSATETIKYLKNFLEFEIIQEFENKYRNIDFLIKDYSNLVESFNAYAKEKSLDLVTYLKQDLQQHQLSLQNNKRSLEIKRIIERKRKWSIAKFVDKFYVELFSGIKVWLCTPDVVSEIFPLKPGLFDVVIFDEASQLYIEKAIPAIYRAKQVVIAGDSKQLRPSSLGFGRFGYDELLEDDYIDTTAALDEESLLDLARFKFSAKTLNFHYRSLFEEIINFSNSAFYKNELIVSPNAKLPKLPSLSRIKVEYGRWINRQNEAEADRVVVLIQDILTTRENNETIGIITFNATQRALIEKKLEDKAIEDKEFGSLYYKEVERKEDNQDLSLFVKNIENVQGDERDIIIFSITYGYDEKGKVPSFFGWLSQQGGENRLNVAITRAKRQVIVVTSIEPYELPIGNSQAKGPQLLQQYLAYAKAISEEDEGQAQTILNSLYPLEQVQSQKPIHPLTLSISNWIQEAGYQTKLNYGLGATTIELVVLKENEIIKGFEFDHTVYNKNQSIRTTDIHHPNYLKARGWNVTRLFSYDYYHNPEKFKETVLNYLNT